MSSDELLRRGALSPTTVSGALAARRQHGQTERQAAQVAGKLERRLIEEEAKAVLRSTRERNRHRRVTETVGHIGDEVAFATSLATTSPAAAPLMWSYLSAVNAARIDEELQG